MVSFQPLAHVNDHWFCSSVLLFHGMTFSCSLSCLEESGKQMSSVHLKVCSGVSQYGISRVVVVVVVIVVVVIIRIMVVEVVV